MKRENSRLHSGGLSPHGAKPRTARRGKGLKRLKGVFTGHPTQSYGLYPPYGITHLSPDTGERAQPGRPVLDLPIPNGWKVELTWAIGYIPRSFAC